MACVALGMLLFQFSLDVPAECKPNRGPDKVPSVRGIEIFHRTVHFRKQRFIKSYLNSLSVELHTYHDLYTKWSTLKARARNKAVCGYIRPLACLAASPLTCESSLERGSRGKPQ